MGEFSRLTWTPKPDILPLGVVGEVGRWGMFVRGHYGGDSQTLC